jgi:hypothetical protein
LAAGGVKEQNATPGSAPFGSRHISRPFWRINCQTQPLVDVSSVEDRAASMTCAMLLVQDNLNTHTKASLYEAFPAAEARRLAERFEWHY